MKHLKNPKITNTSEKYYTISAVPGWKDSGVSKIRLTISKKTGRLVKYVETLSEETYTHLSSTETFTVTGGHNTMSNICYGETALSLPDELKGK